MVKFKLRLHTLLLLGYSFFTVVLIAVMSTVAYSNGKQLVLEKSLQYQNQQMDHLRDYIVLHLQESENSALTVSENAEILAALLDADTADIIRQRENRQKIINILASTANTKPYIFSINIVSGDFANFPRKMTNSLYHEYDVNSVIAEKSYLLSDAGWINAFDGGFIQYAASDNSNFLHYYKNIRYRNGARRLATVVVTIDPVRLMDSVFGRLDMNPETVSLLNEEGQILYGGIGAGIGENYEGVTEPTGGIDGGMSDFVFVRDIPGAGFTLIYNVEAAAMTAGINEMLGKMVVIGLCVFILSIPVVSLISWSVSKPVRNLAKDMVNTEKNGFHSNREESAIKELDSLWKGYGRLLRRIQSLITAIRAEQDHKRRTELKLLQAQINPHFIYNSIELINWTARRHNVPEICDIVFHLGRMLRISLNRGEDVLTVERELEHVESYLKLQHYKYENSFQVEWEIEERVKKGYTIKLLLQPLVENCIYHGFAGIDYGGKIVISARIEKEDAVFTVRDNGCGMEEEMLAQILKKESRGYGVHNIEERVKLCFGEEYGLSYLAVETGGTEVTLRIPFTTDPAGIQEGRNELSGIFD